MSILFIAFCIGILGILPLYAISLHHDKFLEKFGESKGNIISNVLSILSGWLFFSFWIGIWLSPQERFTIPIFQDIVWILPINELSISAVHLLISIPLFIIAVVLGIGGVTKISLKVAETHRPIKVVDTGIYSIVRNPQYLAGLVAHLSLSIMFSGLYSLIFTPVMILVIIFMCKQEEKLMIREFGQEYIEYMNRTPMLIPFMKKTNRGILEDS